MIIHIITSLINMNYYDLTSKNYIDYGLIPLCLLLILFWVIGTIFMAMDHYCVANNLLETMKYQGKSIKNGIDWYKYHR